MKKLFILLLSGFVFFSCTEQDILNDEPIQKNNPPTVRMKYCQGLFFLQKMNCISAITESSGQYSNSSSSLRIESSCATLNLAKHFCLFTSNKDWNFCSDTTGNCSAAIARVCKLSNETPSFN